MEREQDACPRERSRRTGSKEMSPTFKFSEASKFRGLRLMEWILAKSSGKAKGFTM